MSEETSFVPSLEEPEEFKPTPLVRFKGKLSSYEAVNGTNEQSGRNYSAVRFNFEDLEVLETTEPFPFDSTTIQLSYNTRAKTNWDAWRASAVKFIPSKSLDDLVGKVQEWYYGPIIVRRPPASGTGKWEETDGKGWTIVDVEGANSESDNSNIYSAVVDLVAGKTDEQFYESLFSNSKIKKMPGYMDIVEDATKRELLTKLEGMKQIVKHPDGKWAKV